MSGHPHRARGLVARGTLSVALVLALSGALFAANARFSKAGPAERHPENLADLAQEEVVRVDDLTGQVDSLRAEVERLTKAATAGDGSQIQSPSVAYQVEGGISPVSGEGLSVSLDDAPSDRPGLAGVSPDVLLVHQQDIQAVMNALWAGGAEAMTLMDQRVISTSIIRCAGNVLRLQGLVYSPPYIIRAVGDPAALRAALDDSPEVRAYLADADEVGLGWEVDEHDDLVMPAYAGTTQLKYATVPPGTTVLPGLPENDGAAPQAAGTDKGTRTR